MKNSKFSVFFIMLIATIVSTSLSGQSNNVPANATFTYCEVTCNKMVFGKKIYADVDYGGSKTETINDEKGKIKNFNTPVEVLNHMGDNGWEFVQAYALGENNGSVYHYIMRKKK